MKTTTETYSKILESLKIMTSGSDADTPGGDEVQDIVDILNEDQNLKDLEHHKSTTTGLWATDRPDLIKDPDKVLFQIKD